MPERETIRRAREDAREGQAPSTQAGEFVKEEMDHIREGKHGARSTKQAIAIGLSKARRSGVKLGTPRGASSRTRRSARSASRRAGKRPSPRRSRAMHARLEHERHDVATPKALARFAKRSARKRGRSDRVRAAKRAQRTKGAAGRSAAARKAARTRKRTASASRSR